MAESAYKKYGVNPDRSTPTTQQDRLIDSVEYKWPSGSADPVIPEIPLVIKVVSGQEDSYREEGGVRVENDGKARVTFATNKPIEGYWIAYLSGPTPWQVNQMDLISEDFVLGETFFEHYFSEDLAEGLYSFAVTVFTEDFMEELQSDVYYLRIGYPACPPGETYVPTPLAFPPTNRSEWTMWGEIDDPDGPVFTEGDSVQSFRNSSTRKIAEGISIYDGVPYTYREYGINGRQSISLGGSSTSYGYKATDGIRDVISYAGVTHLMMVAELPTLTPTTFITLFKTGNLGGFNGYTEFKLYSNRIEAQSVSYGFYSGTYLSYTIPLTTSIPTGTPIIFHAEFNCLTGNAIIRVNGSILGGVSFGVGNEWTYTAGSIDSGRVNVLFFPSNDKALKFSALGVGTERIEELTPSIVENTSLYLAEKYRIPYTAYQVS